MSRLADAVEEFLDDADTVYDEYEKGYMDADVALARLEEHVDALAERTE